MEQQKILILSLESIQLQTEKSRDKTKDVWHEL